DRQRAGATADVRDGGLHVETLGLAEAVAAAGGLAVRAQVEGEDVEAAADVVVLQLQQALLLIGARALDVVDEHDGGASARRVEEPAAEHEAIRGEELDLLVAHAEVGGRALHAA